MAWNTLPDILVISCVSFSVCHFIWDRFWLWKDVVKVEWPLTKLSPYYFPDRIEKVAADIYNDVIKDHENEPISALCVLKGGYKFFTDVLNKMTQLNSIGDKSVQISTEFIRLKSYVDERYEPGRLLGE